MQQHSFAAAAVKAVFSCQVIAEQKVLSNGAGLVRGAVLAPDGAEVAEHVPMVDLPHAGIDQIYIAGSRPHGPALTAHQALIGIIAKFGVRPRRFRKTHHCASISMQNSASRSSPSVTWWCVRNSTKRGFSRIPETGWASTVSMLVTSESTFPLTG